MIADDLDEWATRLETIALPASVIAAEARMLAAKARAEELTPASSTLDADADAQADISEPVEEKPAARRGRSA